MIKPIPHLCIAAIIWCACDASPGPDEPVISGSHAHNSNATQNTTSQPDGKSGDSAPAPILASELAAILAVRQQGFDLLAGRYPDKTTLAIELIRTTDDATAAIFTVAQGSQAARYIVMGDGDGRVPEPTRSTTAAPDASTSSAVSLVANGVIDPATLAISGASRHGTDNLDLVRTGARLLANVFGSIDHPDAADIALDSASLALRRELADGAQPSGQPAMMCPPRGLPTQSQAQTDVSVARWRGFQRLADRESAHQILAVELFRTLDDQTAAVFTLSKNRRPARYVATGDGSGKLGSTSCSAQNDAMNAGAAPSNALSAADGSAADPGIVALGHPPPEEPVTPGIVAVSSVLLGAAFDVGEFADTPAE